MASVNEHTGATLRTKEPSDAYKAGWDRIFGSRTQSEHERTQNVGSSEQLPSNCNE
jgi:hypothetical protein